MVEIKASVTDNIGVKSTMFYWPVEIKVNSGPPRFKESLEIIYVIPLVPKRYVLPEVIDPD